MPFAKAQNDVGWLGLDRRICGGCLMPLWNAGRWVGLLEASDSRKRREKTPAFIQCSLFCFLIWPVLSIMSTLPVFRQMLWVCSNCCKGIQQVSFLSQNTKLSCPATSTYSTDTLFSILKISRSIFIFFKRQFHYDRHWLPWTNAAFESS